MKLLKPSESLEISLDPFKFELLTVSPVKVLPRNGSPIRFAPLGLVNMLNGGGAVERVEVEEDGNKVKVGVKGYGEMKAFASEEPKTCKINGECVKSSYGENMVVVEVAWPGSLQVSTVEFLF